MTLIEWLQDKLNNVRPTQICSIETIKEWVEKAKEMHEKEAFEFWNGGINSTEEGGKSFEQYYNEKFKKD